MQSMFRLPWSTEPQSDKFCDKMAFAKPRPVPIADISLMSKLKRKRADSADISSSPIEPSLKKSKAIVARGEVQPVAVVATPTSRLEPDGVVAPPGNSLPSATVSDQSKIKLTPAKQASSKTGSTARQSTLVENGFSAQPSTASDMESHMTPFQQAIEAQFNLEILMKHRELQLIEQELAKAQIALEQLRRCQLIPFPGTLSPSENVSNGTGAALRPQAGYTQPPYAAPWGVTDGPYTKHYAKWLIPDPRFDSVPISSLPTNMEGRATRQSFADPHATSKSRNSRNSATTLKLHSLGEAAAPAPKVDPLLHKRSTDGQWVRLYCPSCKHSNFSNTQGFLNHCRIKHGQIFKSHDAAAIAFGVPVDVDELGTPLPPPPPSAIVEPAVATPVSAPVPVAAAALASSTLVHPLIKADPPQLAKSLPPRRVTAPVASMTTLMTPTLTPGSKKTDYFSTPVSAAAKDCASSGSSFIPSPQTPYINGLFEKHGMFANLKSAVDLAKMKVDFFTIETSSEDEATPGPTKDTFNLSQPMARMPSRGGIGPAHRPASKKGQSDSARGPAHRAPTSLNLSATPSLGNSDSHAIPESPVELSPNTVESNPGLVSDDDDEDDDDDNCSVSQMDRDGDVCMNHPIVVDDGSDAECERRKGMESFKKAGSSQNP